jgi:transposase
MDRAGRLYDRAEGLKLVGRGDQQEGAALAKLGEEEKVAVRVLSEKGTSKSAIARSLGVTEGTVRYHLRRTASGAVDGRKKESLIERLGLSGAVREWWAQEQEVVGIERSPSIQALWDHLRSEHGYRGSYKSVRRYVRGHLPRARLRPYRRVETPPGAQTQSDWFEVADVDLGSEGPERLYGFVMVLSHSRKEAVVWSREMKQLDWHRCHNEAYKRLGGVAAVNRIDNLKTGVACGAGPWGQINESYRSYARGLGFHVDAHEAGRPEQKGKVERRVGVVERLRVSGRRFAGLAGLQAWTDRKLGAQAAQRICPATGLSVAESWEAEKRFLRPLPVFLPEPFDLVRQCPVHKDCTVRFEGRSYAVPFRYLSKRLEGRGCAGSVQFVDPETGAVVKEYPRGTPARVLLDTDCYEGPPTATVLAPRPLGRMARKLQELAALPVQKRPLDLYAALAEVAR